MANAILMSMSKPRKQPGAAQRKLLHALIQERELREGEYTLVFVTGEGELLPGGPRDDPIEELSGKVLDRQGRVFSFWLGWDPANGQPGLTEWQQVQPQPHWLTSAE